jgi:hypothetical protein
MTATDEPTLREALGVAPLALTGLNQPLWLQNSTYPAAVDRQLIAAGLETGVLGLNELAVTQRAAGANLSVDVAAGRAVVPVTDAPNLGSALCVSTAINNLIVAGAPGAGTSRIDLVIARVYDASIIGGSINGWQLEVVTGTPAASPAVPATPASSIVLARIAVASGQVSVTTANITDTRVMPGIWRPYTPVWSTGLAAQPLVGNGTIGGRYMVRAKTCSVVIKVVFGSTTGGGNGAEFFSLPVTAANPQNGPNQGLGTLFVPSLGGAPVFIGVALLENAATPRVGLLLPADTAHSNTNFWQMTDASNTTAAGVPNVPSNFNVQNGGYVWIAATYETA